MGWTTTYDLIPLLSLKLARKRRVQFLPTLRAAGSVYPPYRRAKSARNLALSPDVECKDWCLRSVGGFRFRCGEFGGMSRAEVLR